MHNFIAGRKTFTANYCRTKNDMLSGWPTYDENKMFIKFSNVKHSCHVQALDHNGILLD